MKKLIILTAVIFSVSISASMAQSTSNKRSNLKGPKAKNQKAWDKKADQKSDIVVLPSGDLKGPKAKNTTPAERTPSDVVVRSKGGKRIMGPKGKNQRPGTNSSKTDSVINENDLAQE